MRCLNCGTDVKMVVTPEDRSIPSKTYTVEDVINGGADGFVDDCREYGGSTLHATCDCMVPTIDGVSYFKIPLESLPEPEGLEYT
ncbi:MAG: hypothetical protein Q8M92_04280 [Candidatus Subteraquimicrobiales bacterium]|nr:hypothetical protein [Candidatus Subteraquimicrobiales bacterium]